MMKSKKGEKSPHNQETLFTSHLSSFTSYITNPFGITAPFLTTTIPSFTVYNA
jgi:hypothetical protein